MNQFEMFGQEALTPTPPADPPPPPAPGPEAARNTSLRITGDLLGQLRHAETMPWDAGEVSMFLAMFRAAAKYLEPDEAATRLADMDAELARLNTPARCNAA